MNGGFLVTRSDNFNLPAAPPVYEIELNDDNIIVSIKGIHTMTRKGTLTLRFVCPLHDD